MAIPNHHEHPQTQQQKWSSRVWHRKTARPVMVWMVLFLIAGMVHTLLPNYRWLLIHMFTLGILSNSIVVWSQLLTERFLQQKLSCAARPAQLARTRILNIGIVITGVGEVLEGSVDKHWWVTWLGALVVAGALTWHGVALLRQVLRADKAKRFRSTIVGFVASAFALPLGAVFGAALSMELPGALQQQTLLAHTLVNLGGFVGLAVASALTVLFPAIWRVNGLQNRAPVFIPMLIIGLAIAITGAFADIGWIAATGLFLYAAGWLYPFHGWLLNVLTVLKDPRDRLTYASLSVFVAVIWLITVVISYGVEVWRAGGEIYRVDLPTMPLLLGFGAQLLFGAMSYLLPTTMGGGPAAKRAGLRELERAGIFRVVLFNAAFIAWQVSANSWGRIIFSLLVFGVLVAFIPLMIRSVKAQKALALSR